MLSCDELEPTRRFFCERLAFRLDTIFPADDPRVAVLSGHGLRLRLEVGATATPATLRLACRDVDALAGGERALTAPNGTRVVLEPADPPVVVPALEPALVVSRLGTDSRWTVGRAGMRYRDLIPGRLGGRFVASVIEIPDGGPVPDSVHFHSIRFQLIYCYRGWVRVVYEDQGPAFVLEAGDCVVQPPEIRHRVLESSPGLAVIELTSPARHETTFDHELTLPTERVAPDRAWNGQRFVRHVAAEGRWRPWRRAGFEARDLGVAGATGGLAEAHVARRVGDGETRLVAQDAELRFTFVLEGSARLRCDGEEARELSEGDAFAIPAGLGHALVECSDDLELLELGLPASDDDRP